MSTHIAFFYWTVFAGIALGLGCLAAGLYFEFVGERRRKKKDIRREDIRRLAGRRSGTATA
jgi:hypothetical protein